MTRERYPIVGRYAEIMGLKDLIDVALDPSSSVRMCPVCQDHPLMAVESSKTPPFLWRCEDIDHYWRRKDDAPPRDGKIVCRSCGGTLEFRPTGNRRYWRCTDNHRHRVAVHRDHLRLPAMRQLVPRSQLSAMEREWKLDSVHQRAPRSPKFAFVGEAPAAPAAPVDGMPLAPRELDVLRLMAGDGSYTAIAADLRLKPDTVKSYAKEIRRKLGVSTREGAVEAARTRGWL